MNEDALQQFRVRIDAIDDQIVDLLSERFQVVSEVAEFKKQKGLKIYHSGREQDILKRVSGKGKKLGLNTLLLEALFMQIFSVSKREQRDKQV